MKTEHKQWLFQLLKGMVGEPNELNFAIKKGRCDLEIILRVSEKDKVLFPEEIISLLKEKISAKTGVFDPVIYLEGNEPKFLKEGHYI